MDGWIQSRLLMTMRLPGIPARLLGDTRSCVIEAANGSDGLRRTRQQHPQVIFLHLVLSDRTGFEVMDWLKSIPVPRGIPIVITSTKQPEERGRCRHAAEAVAILRKVESQEVGKRDAGTETSR